MVFLGGVAQFPEHADEASPRELSGQLGHQLNFRPLAVSTQRTPTRREFVERAKTHRRGWEVTEGTALTDRKEVRMAYYKVRIEVWCDWNPAESDLEDIAQSMGVGEAICTMREVVAVVDRPQDIEDEEAMSFFGGSEGDADESQG